MEPQSFVYFFKDLSGGGKVFRQILPHPCVLRPLPGKDVCDCRLPIADCRLLFFNRQLVFWSLFQFNPRGKKPQSAIGNRQSKMLYHVSNTPPHVTPPPKDA